MDTGVVRVNVDAQVVGGGRRDGDGGDGDGDGGGSGECLWW